MSRMLIVVCALSSAGVFGQTFGGNFTPLPIPDGLSSTCGIYGPSSSVTINVPPGTPTVALLSVSIGITHTWYGDVRFTLIAPNGTAVQLLGTPPPNCGDASDLTGAVYTLDDTAAQTLDAAAIAAGATIPSGTYRPDAPLSTFLGVNPVGNWTFVFADGTLGDTGSVASAFLAINACTQPSYSLSQSGPGQALVIRHLCGQPFNIFFAPAVFGSAGTNPGGVPTGWYLGLNIPVQALLDLLNFGQPFLGTLNSAGNYAISAFVPPGIDISTVAVHVNPSTGVASYISAAFTYTTL